MTLSADLFWSFRSPYSYLAIKRYRQLIQDYDVNLNFRPVYPLAIRDASFFDNINPQWISYLLRDCQRIAEYHQLPFKFPSPDPVVMDMQTREISKVQPYIFWITRLGVGAAKVRNRGIEFADEISSMVWGGITDWNNDDNMAAATRRAGLNYEELQRIADDNIDDIDAEIATNQTALEKSGHWGVPTLAYNNEAFFGQDRIELAIWRMRQDGLSSR